MHGISFKYKEFSDWLNWRHHPNAILSENVVKRVCDQKCIKDVIFPEQHSYFVCRSIAKLYGVKLHEVSVFLSCEYYDQPMLKNWMKKIIFHDKFDLDGYMSCITNITPEQVFRLLYYGCMDMTYVDHNKMAELSDVALGYVLGIVSDITGVSAKEYTSLKLFNVLDKTGLYEYCDISDFQFKMGTSELVNEVSEWFDLSGFCRNFGGKLMPKETLRRIVLNGVRYMHRDVFQAENIGVAVRLGRLIGVSFDKMLFYMDEDTVDVLDGEADEYLEAMYETNSKAESTFRELFNLDRLKSDLGICDKKMDSIFEKTLMVFFGLYDTGYLDDITYYCILAMRELCKALNFDIEDYVIDKNILL